MPTLKLVSIYTNPYKLLRRTLTTPRKSSHRPTSPSPQPLCLNIYTADNQRLLKKVPPCPTPTLGTSPQNLGFRNCKGFSSDDRGVVAERGCDDKDDVNCDQNGEFDQQKRLVVPEDEQPSKLLTLPTVLTIARVAAVPLLVNTFYMDSWLGTTATTSIFVLASITDWLDGYLARKMKLSSQFGAFLDPVADKLMVATTLILLCTRPLSSDTFGQIPWLLTVPAIAIIGREITMSAVREWAASQDSKLLEAVAVNNLGKWKTATQMTSLTILLAARDSSLVGAGGVVTGVVLLYVSAWLAVWSLFVYMKKISKVLLKRRAV